jgi:hypothetical protein
LPSLASRGVYELAARGHLGGWHSASNSLNNNSHCLLGPCCGQELSTHTEIGIRALIYQPETESCGVLRSLAKSQGDLAVLLKIHVCWHPLGTFKSRRFWLSSCRWGLRCPVPTSCTAHFYAAGWGWPHMHPGHRPPGESHACWENFENYVSPHTF